jgi:hypothetical protein
MLTKKEQLKNNGNQKKKLCQTCCKFRELKFFTSTRAKECLECQRKKKRFIKQNSMSAIEKKLDKAWSERIRSIGKCEYCGSTEHLNAHHIFSRANKATRYDLENGICLCSLHHTFSHTFSAHKTPVEFTRWLDQYKGRDFVDKLSEKAKNIKKWSVDDLKELLKEISA